MKQVPAGTKVDIDPETGAMKRLSGETRTNPYDLFALEAALQLREKVWTRSKKSSTKSYLGVSLTCC